MADVFIKKLDNVHIQMVCEQHIRRELEDSFKFRPPGYQFVPSFKNRYWDGFVRLVNPQTGIATYGLWSKIKSEAELRDYTVEVDPAIAEVNDDITETAGFDLAELYNTKYLPRDYQNKAVAYALKHKRGLLLSPTASGKSFIIYLITRYLAEELGKRVLIVVPTVSLTRQMTTDFINYNNGEDIGVHEISAGVTKQTDLPVVVSTWQSLLRVTRDYLDQYDVVIVDEAHQAKSTAITKLLEKMPNVEWRLGFTGTIPDDGPVNQLTLEGLFGEVFRVTTTHQLIQDETLASFDIKALVLEHPKLEKPKTYQDEIDLVISSEARNKFIVNLASSLKGNTLILFNYVERHGMPLYELLKQQDKNVFFIHGSIKADERDEIRKALEDSTDNILLASVGTTSTGVNIVNLDNVIFAHPTKSKIRNLQSIGRVLRKNGDNKATLYDIVDDLRAGRKITNYSLKHFEERAKQYANEKFKVKYYQIPLK